MRLISGGKGGLELAKIVKNLFNEQLFVEEKPSMVALNGFYFQIVDFLCIFVANNVFLDH